MFRRTMYERKSYVARREPTVRSEVYRFLLHTIQNSIQSGISYRSCSGSCLYSFTAAFVLEFITYQPETRDSRSDQSAMAIYTPQIRAVRHGTSLGIWVSGCSVSDRRLHDTLFGEIQRGFSDGKIVEPNPTGTLRSFNLCNGELVSGNPSKVYSLEHYGILNWRSIGFKCVVFVIKRRP